MRALRRVAGIALALAALSPGRAAAAEWIYADGDIRVQSPGEGWIGQAQIPGAPNVRAAFVKPRSQDRGSVISFLIDGTPEVPSASDYAKKATAALMSGYGYKVKKAADFTWKGSPAARAEMTDAEGKRHIAQATIRTPRGGMLIVTLVAADSTTYAEDIKAFLGFLDRIEVAPAKKGSP